MPVTKDNYLVGRVVETNYLSSRVLLLNDLNSRIPVTLNQGAQAILSGSGTKNPILEYLPEDFKCFKPIMNQLFLENFEDYFKQLKKHENG